MSTTSWNIKRSSNGVDRRGGGALQSRFWKLYYERSLVKNRRTRKLSRDHKSTPFLEKRKKTLFPQRCGLAGAHHHLSLLPSARHKLVSFSRLFPSSLQQCNLTQPSFPSLHSSLKKLLSGLSYVTGEGEKGKKKVGRLLLGPQVSRTTFSSLFQVGGVYRRREEKSSPRDSPRFLLGC